MEAKVEQDTEMMVELKNQEYEKLRAQNAKHQFELVKLEEQLQKVLVENHRFRMEDAQKQAHYKMEAEDVVTQAESGMKSKMTKMKQD